MPNKHKHTVKGVRGMDDTLTAEFDAAARRAGGDRSSVTRRFWEWFAGRPGAELPGRPHAGPWRYRIGDINYATAPEALARAMETVEREGDLDKLAAAQQQRPEALAALQRGEPWLLGETVMITPVR